MSTQDTLFVIVDPTQKEHVALERAVITSRLRDIPPKLKVFVAVDGASVSLAADNPALYRTSEWFDHLKQPLIDEGLEFTLMVCWSNQWHDAVLQGAEKTGADMILMPDYSARESRNRFTDAKWQVLRHANCPVLICRPGANSQRRVVLAAVKMQDTSPQYVDLCDKVINRGKWMAERYGADFQVVNAYADSLSYPDRGLMLRKLGISPEKIHVRQGTPDEVVTEVAQEIHADIIVVGTLRRRGLMAAMRGNTSEQVMSRVSQDIMTLN